MTIYRDDLALITETRTVDLPAGAVTLVVEDVVETLLPQSAIVTEPARPLAESNFDFDRLTPHSLLERSIGETVTITRTNPATGRVTRTAATIVSVGEGVVLQTADGTRGALLLGACRSGSSSCACPTSCSRSRACPCSSRPASPARAR